MKRFLTWPVVVLLVLAMPHGASACSVCMGGPASEQSKGLGLAIFVLLGVTYLIISGLIAYTVQFCRRSRMIAAMPENKIYQDPDERIHS